MIDRCEECKKHQKRGIQDVHIVDGIRQCETCEYSEGLYPENEYVFEVYNTINTQFVYDFGAYETIFNLATAEMSREDRLFFQQKINKIHELFSAKRK